MYLTLLNSDYKIIAKILAERLKDVLPKLIHSDQKGFVKGRNISEANRLIQDVIEYNDREDDDGIIIFLDQQKAFDRVEWGWVDHVLSKFNFGENLGNGFKCYSNMHKLVSRPMVLCLNISIFQGPVDKGVQ